MKQTCGALLHQALAKRLEDTSYRVVPDDSVLRSVSGTLISEEYKAKIEVVFDPRRLKLFVPVVYCEEEWIRRELDWHYVTVPKADGWKGKNFLCWIYPNEWWLAHNHSTKKINEVIVEGSDWLLNNATKLIEMHWVGHTLGIKHWKDEWSQWLHGKEGQDEFERERATLGHPANWKIL